MLKEKKIFFPNLDGLRVIAFFLVFLQHGFYNFFKNFEGRSPFSDKLVSLFFVNGGTGVQIFFVLSGFLITYLILKEIEKNGRINLGSFYMRRTLRIWPLYFATVIFAFVIYPYFKSLVGVDSGLCSRPWYYFTFLANFDSIHIAKFCPGRDAMSQGIVWSVSIEEQFYLFWPLLFFLVNKRLVWLPFVFIIIVSSIFKAIYYEDITVLYFHTLSVISDLAIGGLLAYLVLFSQVVRSFFENQTRIAIIFVYAFIASYFLFDLLPQFSGSFIFNRYIRDLFFGYVILEQNFSKNSFYKLGNFKRFSSWGKYTYGLYMLHPIGILIVDVTFRLLHVNTTSLWVLLLNGFLSFGLSLILARLSYSILELPFLRLKERFTIIKNRSVEPNNSIEVSVNAPNHLELVNNK